MITGTTHTVSFADSNGERVSDIGITQDTYRSFEHTIDLPGGRIVPDMLNAWITAHLPEGATSYRIVNSVTGEVEHENKWQ